MNKKNRLIIIIVALLVLSIGTGYAYLSNQLRINGNSKVTGVWDIEITDAYGTNITGTAAVKSISHDTLTASFELELLKPGDKVDIIIPIKNKGNIPAKLNELLIEEEGTDAIRYTVTGMQENDVLYENGTSEIRIEAYYVYASSSIEDENYKDITVTLNFTQQ